MRKVIHTLERLAALGLRPRPAASAATPPPVGARRGRVCGGAPRLPIPQIHDPRPPDDFRMTSGRLPDKPPDAP